MNVYSKSRQNNLSAFRACLESFFQSHFSDILSEKSEGRRSVAKATLRRTEGFAAEMAQNGVGKKIMNRLLDLNTDDTVICV